MQRHPRFKNAATQLDPPGPADPFVRRILLVALVALLAAPAAVGAAPPLPLDPEHQRAPGAQSEDLPSAQAAQYTVGFECPDVVPVPGLPAEACPTYVLDREDVMGSPILVADPRNPSMLAFAALHGGRGVHPPGFEPPTGRSRDDAVHQPHTTFATKNGGTSWADMPYHAPDSLRGPTREVYGEDVAIALDASGRLHIAALYAHRAAAGPFSDPTGFENVVAVWKAHDIARPVDYYVNVQLLSPEDPAATVDSIHLIGAPDAGLVALLWREGGTSLGLHYSRETEGASWTRVALDLPCAAMSNPVAQGTRILVACRAAEDGPWSVHAIDTATWTSAPLGDAPITTPRALLVERFGDFVILVGSGLDAEGAPSVELSYGEGGARWSAVEQIAGDLTRGDPVAPLLDARVTAAVYNPLTGNVHLVYMEHYDLAAGSDGQPELYKVFAAIRAEGTFQAAVDLGIGSVNRVAFSPSLTGVGAGAYDDIHDGLVIWTDPNTGAVREFLAFGDYGFVRFAEVVEENFLSPIAPLTAQVPPVPVASAGTVPVLVGAPAAILAGAMVARTVWARRQAAAEAPAE